MRSFVAATAIFLFALTARAQPTRIAAIDVDPELQRAIVGALTPWNVEIVPQAAPAPPFDVSGAMSAAERIASASGARAVVWVVLPSDEAHWSLWIYDADAHQITVRALPAPPPYDEVSAAALALTVKTVLRNVVTGPKRHIEPASPRAPVFHHRFRLQAIGSIRFPTNAASAVEPRWGLAASWWPPWFRQRVGLAFDVSNGGGAALSHPLFSGQFRDSTIRFTVAGDLPLARWVSLTSGLGAGIHFSSIEGVMPGTGLYGHATRTAPALELVVALNVRVAGLLVGPCVGASFLGHYQRYSALDQPVLDVPPVHLETGVRIGVESR